MDGADRVIHCGSFNKTLFNALRVGYAVVPKRWRAACRGGARPGGRRLIEQMTLARFLEDGASRAVRKARACMRAGARAAGADRPWAPMRRVSGRRGFHLLWWLPPGWDARQVVEARPQGRRRRCRTWPNSRAKATPAPGVIGYSAVDEARLRRLGALLALPARCGIKGCCNHAATAQ